MKKIIIIPAYNEEANIERTVEAIKKEACGFDYVIINDDFNKALHDLESVINANRLTMLQQARRHQQLIEKLLHPEN